MALDSGGILRRFSRRHRDRSENGPAKVSTIRKRLEKLERSIPPIVDPDAAWGELAAVRDDYLKDQAQEHGEAYAADLKKQLQEDGPVRFHIEIIEGYLKLHGIEPGPNESFAMTVARALGIGTSELGVRMQEGTVGRDLWHKFGDVNNAADNEKDSIGSAHAKASSGMP